MARIRAHAPRVAARDSRTVQPAPKRADAFYASPEWRALIKRLIAERGRRCQSPSCRRTHDDAGNPVRIFGDHINELRDGGAPLDADNVSLLCGSCHTKKTLEERARRIAERF